MGFRDLFFTVTSVFTKFIKLTDDKNDKICYTNTLYTHSSFQYYILNIKMWLYSQSKLEDHATGKGDLWIT